MGVHPTTEYSVHTDSPQSNLLRRHWTQPAPKTEHLFTQVSVSDQVSVLAAPTLT